MFLEKPGLVIELVWGVFSGEKECVQFGYLQTDYSDIVTF